MTQKIQGKFYPLTNGITKILRQAKLTAAEWRIWSYLVELDPWGDRYEDFDYLSVISICECSKPTFYRAIAKFQELKLFDFQARGLSLRNLTGVSHLDKSESSSSTKTEADKTEAYSSSSKPKPKPKPKPKTEPEPEPETEQDITDECPTIHKNKPHAVSKMRNESQKFNSSLKIEKRDSKMRNESQICNNEGLKPLSDIASSFAQTLQTELDHPYQPDQGGEQSKFQDEEVNQSEQVNFQAEEAQSKSKKAKEKQNHKHTTKTTEKEESPRDVAQEKSKIPDELLEKLRALEIPLDEKVLKAIASHHISQAYGAIAHIENTWETIDNPRSIFLFQIPKQKIEKLGMILPEIGSKMREENEAIEEEMATDEYQAKSQEMFAKIREKLGKGGKKQ